MKDVAEKVITALLLPGVEGSPRDSSNSWLVVSTACANQDSIWKACNAPAEHRVTTLCCRGCIRYQYRRFVVNPLLGRLAMTTLDRSGSGIVSVNFIDNSYTITKTNTTRSSASRVIITSPHNGRLDRPLVGRRWL